MENDENTLALKMQSKSGISKIWFCQPLYLGIINLNVNFGAISTLDEKVELSHKPRNREMWTVK